MGNVTTPTASPRGCEWRRWDPHLHAPGTLLSDRFNGDWDAYLERIELSEPRIEALGVTDYFCIRTYQQVRKWKEKNRLENVHLIFPNVEIRMNIETDKGSAINLHLLFSPDDPDHECEIIRALGQLDFEFDSRNYSCTESDLVALGHAFTGKRLGPEAALRAGANQFKVSLTQLKKLFRAERWVQENCLVAVAGSSNDGTAGLAKDASFAATRQEVERFAHIIFASTPKQRDFWLGHAPVAPADYIEKTYGSRKPCLHGSDAHEEERVGAPVLDRYCWLKGDPSFETLRQVILEPDRRVRISAETPIDGVPAQTIRQIHTAEAPWLVTDAIVLNPGLVAIIGARGSGKTALVDILAAGANATESAENLSSFVQRASSPVDHLAGASVQLEWGHGGMSDSVPVSLHVSAYEPWDEQPPAEIRYLSQHFVERLCSAEGMATELRTEIERVVFENTDPTERLETDSFGELTDVLLDPVRRRRDELRDTISELSKSITHEEGLRDKLPALRSKPERLSRQITEGRKSLAAFIPKGKQARAERLGRVEQACTAVQSHVERLKRKQQSIQDLAREVTQTQVAREPSRLLELRRRFTAADLSEPEWAQFLLVFKGDVESILSTALSGVQRDVKAITDGNPKASISEASTPFEQWPLSRLTELRNALRKEVVIDKTQQKKYDELRGTIKLHEGTLRRTEALIKNAEGATSRRQTLVVARRTAYVEVFKTFVEEEQALRQLYAPLGERLVDAQGALTKLSFSVRRRVDLTTWVTRGEGLLDLRNATKFKGQGSLRKHARTYLVPAWTTGTAEDIARAMETFRGKFARDLINARPPSIGLAEKQAWTRSVAEWLYETSHIQIEYGIEYEGVTIERLSPGTRGIVLLLLFLAIDTNDTRPLVIDQPEENLDPNSVFEELVPHFREACLRRQVVIVTHNANLVVNTDADQVIAASSFRVPDVPLPLISYETGSLENGDIRRLVCQILEGGERAFLERQKRYRLRWEQILSQDENAYNHMRQQ